MNRLWDGRKVRWKTELTQSVKTFQGTVCFLGAIHFLGGSTFVGAVNFRGLPFIYFLMGAVILRGVGVGGLG